MIGAEEIPGVQVRVGSRVASWTLVKPPEQLRQAFAAYSALRRAAAMLHYGCCAGPLVIGVTQQRCLRVDKSLLSFEVTRANKT